MAIIKKKILPQFFEAILSGKKKYELRLNDFEVQEGDTLVFEEYNSSRMPTGRVIEKRVAYIGKFKIDELYWPKEEIEEKGLQIISLE